MNEQVLDGLAALVLVAIGGGLGSVARFWVSGAIARRYGGTFPWGTLFVNVSGSAAIGVLAGLLLAPDGQEVQQRAAWAGLAIGLLGSYTTVSSFSLQTLELARNGEGGRALANVALSLALCLASAAATWLATSHALEAWGPR